MISKFVLAFIGTYLAGFAAMVLSDVSWGIYLYEINYFLNPVSRWWYGHLPDIRYSFIIALSILLSYIIRSQRYRENRITDIPQTKWLFMNVVIFSIISFWAVWPSMHNKTLIVHCKLLVFMFIVYKCIDSSEKFEKMIWAFLIGNFYMGWAGHNKGRNLAGRMENFGPSDSGGDGNATSAILVSSIPILLFYVMRARKKWQRFIALVALAFVLDSVVLVNSRGAFLGLAISLMYLLWVYIFSGSKVKLRSKLRMIGMVIVGICLFLYMTDDIFWNRMNTIDDKADAGMKGAGRAYFWIKAVDLTERYPLGLGTWGYQVFSPEFLPEYMLTGGRRAVHNTYLQCLVERGYLGFFIFMSLLVSNFRFYRKSKEFVLAQGNMDAYFLIVAIQTGFFGYLIASIFINRLHAEVLYWYILFTGCFGNIYMLKKSLPGNESENNLPGRRNTTDEQTLPYFRRDERCKVQEVSIPMEPAHEAAKPGKKGSKN